MAASAWLRGKPLSWAIRLKICYWIYLKVSNLLQLVKDVMKHKSPVRVLTPKLSHLTPCNLPRLVGTGPVKLFRVKSRCWIHELLPKETGMSPVSRLLMRVSVEGFHVIGVI